MQPATVGTQLMQKIKPTNKFTCNLVVGWIDTHIIQYTHHKTILYSYKCKVEPSNSDARHDRRLHPIQGRRKRCGQYGHGRTIISQNKIKTQKTKLNSNKLTQKYHRNTLLYNMILSIMCSDIAAVSVLVVFIIIFS